MKKKSIRQLKLEQRNFARNQVQKRIPHEWDNDPLKKKVEIINDVIFGSRNRRYWVNYKKLVEIMDDLIEMGQDREGECEQIRNVLLYLSGESKECPASLAVYRAAEEVKANIGKLKGAQRKLRDELFTGIKEGNAELVRNAIDGGVYIEDTLPNEHLPITYAAHCGYPEIVKLLIDAGADVDTWDDNYCLPLVQILSSPRKHVREDVEAIVKMLIEAGADVDRREGINGSGHYPLLEALYGFASPRVVKMLIDAGADIGEDRGANRPIYQALQNLRGRWNIDDAKSLSDEERLEVVKLMLDAGAKIYRVQDEFCSLIGDNIPAMEFFLNELGADINAQDIYGKTPLTYAIGRVSYNGNTTPMEFLLKNGADIEGRDRDGRTPLCYAATRDDDKYDVIPVKLLIERGADINAQDNDGFTPLMSAVWGHDPKVMEYLLEQGADTTLKTNEGETVVDIARKVDNMDSYCDGEIENPFHGRVALLKKHHVV